MCCVRVSVHRTLLYVLKTSDSTETFQSFDLKMCFFLYYKTFSVSCSFYICCSLYSNVYETPKMAPDRCVLFLLVITGLCIYKCVVHVSRSKLCVFIMQQLSLSRTGKL